MKPGYIGAFLILVLSAGATMFFFSGALAKHVSIKEVLSRPGQVVQVPGKILKDTIVFDRVHSELHFDIQAMEGDERLSVVYSQPKPENFDSADRVEATGTYKNGVFRAESLLVKCPSKYNDEKPAQKADSGFGTVAGFIGVVALIVAIPAVIVARSRA